MTRQRMVNALLPVAAGVVFIAGLSPFGFWPAIIASQATLAFLWYRHPASAACTGLLYGLGFFGAGASWVYVSINVYGSAPPPLAALLTSVFCGGLALLFACQGALWRWLTRGGRRGGILVFAPLWVIFEWLRSWLLTGFPWLYAGYAGLDTPLAGWAPVLGVFGLSGVFAAMAALMVWALAPVERHRVVIASTVILSTFGVGLALSNIEFTGRSAADISVALLQPNIPLEKKWDRRNFRRIIGDYDDALTSTLADPAVDLVIWPESAVPAYRHQAEPWLNALRERLALADAGLITGIPVRDDSGRHNSLIGLARASGEYHKQKLVPFGEYVPLDRLLRGIIAFFDLPMSRFSPGPPNQRMLRFDDLTIGAFICYEIVYPDFVAGVRDLPDILVTVSNDSWFGASIGPWQHLQMARFRALETGRELLRGTNNGVTAIVDHRGRIRATLPQFTTGHLSGSVTPRQGETPFMRWGSYPTLILATIMLLWRRLQR